MAAMWALVLSAECQKEGNCGSSTHAYRLGNAAPYLYSVYAGQNLTGGSFTPHLTYAQTFYDVLYGSNAMAPSGQTPSPSATPIPGYKAMTGYDQVTGVGVPFAGHLIQAITGQPVP
jgi:hypothetical protein